jgi:hypothetical protein
MVKVYLAKAMSGRTGAELVREAKLAQKLCPATIELFDPVVIEGIKVTRKPVGAGLLPEVLSRHWERDKQAIRAAHVVFDMTGSAKSEGVTHEIGYARYCLWKPVVRLWPDLGTSIARLEDDSIVATLEDGFREIESRWGTRAKRFLWRAKMLNRSLPRWVGHQVGEWK